MPSKDDQTPVPPGQEQGGQPPSTSSQDLEKRLADLQVQLTSKDKELAEKEKALKSKDSEARRLQAAADQRASLLTRMSQTNPPPSGRVQSTGQTAQPPAATTHQQQVQELADFANEQAKEVALLREVIKRGLTMDEVEGIVFESGQELNTQLDIYQQKKEIAELRNQLSKSKEGEPPPSLPRMDTGGRSVGEAQQQLEQLKQLRTQATELKQGKKFQEATWVALRAIHNDPAKASMHKPNDEGE